LKNLTSLGLGYNQITSIESDDFNLLTNLQQLNLSSNQITSIESDDFN
jgi:Leucine-rich repeat (LRR) protein